MLALKRDLATAGNKKDFIVDKKFTPWQKRKKQ
jgi:hypothetical protein